jgi:hypothetical protein
VILIKWWCVLGIWWFVDDDGDGYDYVMEGGGLVLRRLWRLG